VRKRRGSQKHDTNVNPSYPRQKPDGRRGRQSFAAATRKPGAKRKEEEREERVIYFASSIPR